MFKCGNCQASNAVPSWVKRGDIARNVKCIKCGSSHSVLDGSIDLISPMPRPVGSGGVMMPWQLPHTRPIHDGFYECRFTGIERVLMLFWNGRDFTHNGQRVRMSSFATWRGEWCA